MRNKSEVLINETEQNSFTCHGDQIGEETYVAGSSNPGQGRQSWGLGFTTPRFLAGDRGGLQIGSWGSRTGREILYLIKYRKYVRMW